MLSIVESLRALIKPTVEALGYELWGLVYQPQGSRAVLRVFIETSKGVTIGDCERASRQIAGVLDAENLIQHAYTLEVSSPGLDRLLFELAHYERCIGKQIKIRLFESIDQQRAFVGKILEVNPAGIIKLDVDGQPHSFVINKIQTAQVVY